MRKIIFITLISLSAALTANAEKIFLKDGGVVQGPIVERGSYFIQVKENGIIRRIINNDIDRIAADDIVSEKYDLQEYTFDNIPAQKVDLLLKFLEINGTRKGLEMDKERILKQTAQSQQVNLSQVYNVDEIIKQLIPVYDKYYSEAEINKLIEFYQSPLGQKMIETSPLVAQEVFKVSKDYFMQKIHQMNAAQ